MRTLGTSLLVLLFAGIATTAFAQGAAQNAKEETDSGYSRTGPYVSFSGVYAVEDWADSNSDAGADNAYGFNLRVGARLSQWASIELELEYLDDFLPDEKTEFGVVSVFGNTRVYPLPGRIQPYGLAGMGIVATVVSKRDSSDSFGGSNADWGFRLGAGVDFYYTDHIAVSVEATQVWTVGDVKDIEHVSLGIGILYRF